MSDQTCQDAQLVLEYRADVNAESISNRTPLFMVSQYELVRLLLGHGADVHNIRGKLEGKLDQTCYRERIPRNCTITVGAWCRKTRRIGGSEQV
ncbi:hypothetical protein BJV78DRAFT_374523 [Lactifluus subvellereus]|nr:hypothetical protein BJV78DRAFT_374523 [Lactifluus subvellereus]